MRLFCPFVVPFMTLLLLSSAGSVDHPTETIKKKNSQKGKISQKDVATSRTGKNVHIPAAHVPAIKTMPSKNIQKDGQSVTWSSQAPLHASSQAPLPKKKPTSSVFLPDAPMPSPRDNVFSQENLSPEERKLNPVYRPQGPKPSYDFLTPSDPSTFLKLKESPSGMKPGQKEPVHPLNPFAPLQLPHMMHPSPEEVAKAATAPIASMAAESHEGSVKPVIKGQGNDRNKVKSISDIGPFLYASYEFRMAQSKLYQSVEAWIATNSSLYPSISLFGQKRLSHSKSTKIAEAGPYRSLQKDLSDRRDSSVGLSLSQDLYKGGSLQAARRQAMEEIWGCIYDFVRVEQEVFLRYIQSFLDLLITRESLFLAEKTHTLLLAVWQHAKALHEAGQEKAAEMETAWSRLAEVVSRVNALKLRCAQIMKEFPCFIAFSDQLIMPEPPHLPFKNLAELQNLALTLNPKIMAAAARQRGARHGSQAQWGALLPSVTLEAKGSRSMQFSRTRSPYFGQSIRNDRTKNPFDAEVALSVNMPLFSGGRLNAQYRSAELKVRDASLDFLNAKNESKLNCAYLFQALQAHQINLLASRKAAEASTKALNMTFKEYGAGMITLAAAMYNQDTWQNACQRYLDTKKELYMTAYQLLAMTGQLTAKNLKLPMTYSDPLAYFRTYAGSLFSLDVVKELPKLLETLNQKGSLGVEEVRQSQSPGVVGF